MTLELDIVGQRLPAFTRSWTARDAMLYALGVGAGQEPSSELKFTTENTEGLPQQALPTMAVVLVDDLPLHLVGDFGLEQVVHGGQELALYAVMPVAGEASLEPRVVAIDDLDKAALIVIETDVVLDGTVIATATHRLFVRGEGGFGGQRTRVERWTRPARLPDSSLCFKTRPEQALLYRLSGDRNPLHSDPAFAARAGFERPILHGLCTYGFVGRGLLQLLCGGDPNRFGTIDARFARPVYPGQEFRVDVWEGPDRFSFQATAIEGDVLVDAGTFSLR
jgi:acyl dehydratase